MMERRGSAYQPPDAEKKKGVDQIFPNIYLVRANVLVCCNRTHVLQSNYVLLLDKHSINSYERSYDFGSRNNFTSFSKTA